MAWLLLILLFTCVLIYWIYYLVIGDRSLPDHPIHGRENGERSSRPALLRFLKRGRQMTIEGLDKVNTPAKTLVGVSCC